MNEKSEKEINGTFSRLAIRRYSSPPIIPSLL
jgi:hypothetical protein